MTRNQLKWFAIIAMLIDHAGLMLFQGTMFYGPMRLIGRLAFPIFCFFLVEGFHHTRNVRKYMMRLLLFGIASEVPFDLMLYIDSVSFEMQTIPQILKIFMQHQNVMWTLLLGLITIWICSKCNEVLLQLPVVLMGMFAAAFLATDYSYFGILMIYFFYRFPIGREDDEYGELTLQKAKLVICQAAVNLACGGNQIFGTAALLPIFSYKGEKGKERHKYFFYLFYPLHMLALVTIHWSIFLR
ncbi:MAG: hypothetical protein E7269_04505 [Lachnospiraceae bacterium]|nr:hypothetical protein [Lachnospiraceae bacterium]